MVKCTLLFDMGGRGMKHKGAKARSAERRLLLMLLFSLGVLVVKTRQANQTKSTLRTEKSNQTKTETGQKMKSTLDLL
jgi:hypothetical protein